MQAKLKDGRATLPAPAKLTVEMLETVKVPAMTSFTHEHLAWWGDRRVAEQNKEMKSLWQRVDKSLFPDKTVALAFPGSAGCKQEWAAHVQELVDGYNAEHVPAHFIHVGRWPDDVNQLHVYPGIKRIGKQLRLVLRTPRPTCSCS